MTKALYAFSGDPITYGHIDIVERAARSFDEIIVGIGKNPDKRYTFSLEERTEMARRSLQHLSKVNVVADKQLENHQVRVVAFEGLLVDYAYEQQIEVIIKGLRDSKDFDYEVQLHNIGDSQRLGIDTFFLPARQELAHVSSSAVKALQKEHGLIHKYVPLYVKQCVEAKISEQYIIGITGEPGTGKSYLGEKLKKEGAQKCIPVHHIELDHIGHKILSTRQEPVYQKIRKQIAETFGKHLHLTDGSIDRKVLGEIVFGNPKQLEKLNAVMYDPLLVGLRQELRGKKGIILFDAALLAESGLTHLCNNNVILVTANETTQQQRLQKRNLSTEQMQRRLASQYRTEEKKTEVEKKIVQGGNGKLWVFDNSEGTDQDQIPRQLDKLIEYFGI
ncbi:pantetheine-phosphate adenylyltransferase [Candidatus Woesearchaeota archaeon]|nr:pantetheine-phosphate adenylyltransferase [Candidatus Woesearchaeota archaeon]